ncbi:MAG: ribonuclease HI [Thermoanaerobaculia bacterium]
MPSSHEPRYRVYTDGGADPNPGAGGWGAVILGPGGGERELSGGEEWATNNRMELTAAIRALEALPSGAPAALYTDSIYLKKGVTEWLPRWIARGWRRRTGELQNEDLWRRLAALIEERDVTWHWVRGHAGHRHNERADRLATREIASRKGGRPGPGAGGEADAEVYLRVSGGGGGGGWAAAVRHGGEERIESGSAPGASANELDVLAAAEVLESLPEGITVALHSASDYLRNGATRWLPSWRRRNWTTKAGTPVRNRAAWERLAAALARREVVWPPLGDPLPEGWKELGKRARDASR